MGAGGVMYHKGVIISGPLESLIDLLLPEQPEHYDAVSFFTFYIHLHHHHQQDYYYFYCWTPYQSACERQSVKRK